MVPAYRTTPCSFISLGNKPSLLLKGRSVRALLSGEDHNGVARELKAQEISWSKLDTSTLLFGAAGNDTQPTGLFSVQPPLLTSRFIAIEFHKGIRVSLTLSALKDNVLIERFDTVQKRSSGSPETTDSVDRKKHVEISWCAW